jgi:diguanylate cyclase (GGDEF)-like protein
MPAASALVLAGGATLSVAYLLLAGHPAAQSIVFLSANLAEVVTIAVTWRRTRITVIPLLLAAAVVYFAANMASNLYTLAAHSPLPFPSAADGGFFVAYALFAAFLSRVTGTSTATDRGSAIDVTVFALAVSAPIVELVLVPAGAAARTLPLDALVTAVAYPAAVLVLLALAVRLMLLTERRTRAHVLLTAWITLELTGAVWYSATSAHGTFRHGTPWFLTGILAYTALAAAVVSPSTPVVASRQGALEVHAGRPLLTLPVLALVPIVTAGVVSGTERRVPYFALTALAVLIGLATLRVRALTVDLPEQRRAQERLHVLAQQLTEQTAAVRAQALEMEHRAVHDSLTGIGNRALFTQNLTHALAQRRTPGRGVGLMLVDLDAFKSINDALGHETGDELLIHVGERLASCARDGDTVARVGGDEFAVVLPDVSLPEVMRVAKRCLAALNAPVEIGRRRVDVQATMGVVVGDRGQDAALLTREADVALYSAKERRLGGFEVFNPAEHVAVLDRHALETELSGAAARNELRLHYQPVLRLGTGAVVGSEALVRWQHPVRGLLGPAHFVPLAEDSGRIAELGAWVLETACRQTVAWNQDTPEGSPLGVAVNVSCRQLVDPGFATRVGDILADVGIDPTLVTLEVTESALGGDADVVIDHLGKLKALGVTLAIDDFGTGYSSLSQLRRLPVDILKIDKSFVSGIARAPEEWALAAAIVKLATSLGKKTLAEGVELGEQLAHIRALGCDLAQGYLFAKPLVPAEFAASLRDGRLRR